MKARVRVIVTGPQGSGKTAVAAWLSEALGITTIIEEWDGKSPLPLGAIATTNVQTFDLSAPDEAPSVVVSTAALG